MQRRIETLEGKAKPGGPRGMPGVKPQSGQRPPREKQNRNPRPHGFARTRMTPTQRVEHVLEECPGCGTGLSGRLDPAHPGGHRPAPGPGAGNRARLYRPHLSSVPAPLCAVGATGGCGAGKAAPGGQPGQPDCCPQGGGPAALAHHPVVPGHGARAAPQPGGPGGRHAQSGRQSPERTGGHCGTHPGQSGSSRR